MMEQWATKIAQNKRKFWHDKHLEIMNFQKGQLVVKYNGKNEVNPGKFKVCWLGPYKIVEVGSNGAIKLSTLDNNPLKYLKNMLICSIIKNVKK